ncbi:Fpg/Nei family DNA glycosylase [Granulicoccus phenolivorans]|uniref:Fpg/Nei family DNA glycosylase n=1 Tax=Granulicoccus phenolivorans TaxID=266854 RepID=UPI00041A005B|nr:DNA-formamidopyrimidine glycosylase family protein [Granulicoccus phenolivorans]
MPEGHTLRRIANELNAHFAGVAPTVSSPQGRFADAAALLNRTAFEGADAHGKLVWARFAEDRIVLIHLGLIGTFTFAPLRPPVGQIRLRIHNDRIAADLRGPQRCQLLTPAELRAKVGKLGPDPLHADADPEQAWKKIHASTKSIGELLMNQAVLAGVGNVYRAEVLFRHGIDPALPGAKLPRAQWDAIWTDLVGLLTEGVRIGRIDTVAPEHTPEAMGRPPRVDDHGGEVYVYRRADLPCLVCGTPVSTRELVGRNLYWCPTCQRR